MSKVLDAKAAAAICEHMNADHDDALLGYARTLCAVADADAARLDSIDATGMDLTIETPSGTVVRRFEFERALNGADDARLTLIALAKAAQGE